MLPQSDINGLSDVSVEDPSDEPTDTSYIDVSFEQSPMELAKKDSPVETLYFDFTQNLPVTVIPTADILLSPNLGL
jgi:hypothetical protein